MDTTKLLMMLLSQAPRLIQTLQNETNMLNSGFYQERINPNTGMLDTLTPEDTLFKLGPNIIDAIQNKQYDAAAMDDLMYSSTEDLNKMLDTSLENNFPSDNIINPYEQSGNLENSRALQFLYSQINPKTKAAESAVNMINLGILK